METYKFGPYIARMTTDVTNRIHLEVVRDDEVVSLEEGDEFITFMSKVPL